MPAKKSRTQVPSKPKAKKAKPKTKGRKPNYKKFPKKIKLYSGELITNPDAGCGPDMFLMNGVCKRKYNDDVLKILCPKVRLAKGSLNPKKMTKLMKEVGLEGTAFTKDEIRELDEHCAKMYESNMDEFQSLDARGVVVYGALKDLFMGQPMLLGKQVFDQLFGVIGYKTSKIAPGYVEVKKRIKSATGAVRKIVKQIPFGSIATSLSRFAKATGSAAYAASTFMSAQGFRAAQWVINSPPAQRLFMHLAKLVKHAICTGIGVLKDRKDMTWKDWTVEKFTVYKTDIFQALQSVAPQIGNAISGALVVGTSGMASFAAPAIGTAVTSLSCLLLTKVAKAGRLQDFFDTFLTGCGQFDYELSTSALKQRILDAGIGTYGPMLLTFFKSIDLTQIQALLM